MVFEQIQHQIVSIRPEWDDSREEYWAMGWKGSAITEWFQTNGGDHDTEANNSIDQQEQEEK